MSASLIQTDWSSKCCHCGLHGIYNHAIANLNALHRAYFHSAATINYIRALLDSGFADLHNPRSWKLSHVHNKELATAFDDIVERLEDSLDFLKVVGGESGTLRKADIWTSHEVSLCLLPNNLLEEWIAHSPLHIIQKQGLMLDFEEALTRSYKDSNGDTHWYNTSAYALSC